MTHEVPPVLPMATLTLTDLERLAAEARQAGQSRRLHLVADDVQVVVSATPKRPRRRRTITPADRAAFLAAAGTWAEVDTDALVQHIYCERERGDRPPVAL